MNNKFDALQNDGSSSSEETTEATDTNQESDTSAITPVPDEHFLQFTYCFWFSRFNGKNVDAAAFERNMKVIGTFDTVEKFWKIYSHMKRVHELPKHNDVHLFKFGIKPLWEDKANKNGGKWVVRLRKGVVARYWENLVLAILGEQFMVGDEICGAVVSIRFQEDILAIWNKTASDQQVTNRIRDTLSRVLNLPASTLMEYKKHHDCIKYSVKKFDRFLETNHHPITPDPNSTTPQKQKAKEAET